MISAARTASGRFLNSGVRATTVTTANTVGDERRASERAPAPSLTADCDRLPPRGQPAEEARADVRDAERDHLLVGVDLVAVLGGERLRGAERLAEDDQHHPGGDGRERGDVARRDVGHLDGRQAARHLADDRHAVIREAQRAADHDAEHQRDQAAGHASRPALGGEQQGQRADADHDRGAARIVQVRDERANWSMVSPPPSRSRAAWAAGYGDEQRQAEHEARDDRAREELGDEPQPQQAGDQEHGAGKQHHPGRRAPRTRRGPTGPGRRPPEATRTAAADVPATTTWRLVPNTAYATSVTSSVYRPACGGRPARPA